MSLIVGVDPGVTAAGLALVELGGMRPVLHVHQRVSTDAADPMDRRLEKIWRALAQLLVLRRPLVLGIEEQAGAQVGAFERGEFHADNSKTMQVVGMVVGCALAYGVPVVRVTPKQVKIAVLGRGQSSASKGQVKAAVSVLCRGDKGGQVEGLTEAGADATAIAIAAGRRHQTGGRTVHMGQVRAR